MKQRMSSARFGMDSDVGPIKVDLGQYRFGFRVYGYTSGFQSGVSNTLGCSDDFW